jgi:DNA-binding PucR family transcriptional regulator
VNDVQALVDALALRLGRPLGVDDRRFQAVAYSSHSSEIDRVRRDSILGREAPAGVALWLRSLGIERARGHVRVPPNQELGMVARVCFPLRFDDHLLGFLWLVEIDAPLDVAELEVARRGADELAEELLRQRHEEVEQRAREAATARRIVAGADHEVMAVAGFASAPYYAVICAGMRSRDGSPLHGGFEVRAREALAHTRRGMAPRHLLADVEADGALAVLACSTPDEPIVRAQVLLDALRSELAAVDEVSAVVGASGTCQQLSGLPRCRDQARLALRVGRALGETSRAVSWEGLGGYRLVGSLVGDRDPTALLPASMLAMLADPDAAVLVPTAEVYLSLAGDAAATAAQLFVHRSTLYNRLRRIEAIAGLGMRSGADRLELHLAFHLWRLAGGSLDSCRDGPA